jgi:hypothetical protein
MADPDIPLAAAIPLEPPTAQTMMQRPDLETATAETGRSSRVLLPTGGQSLREMSQSTRNLLYSQGYTAGLVKALAKNKIAFPIAIWVVDNSGRCVESISLSLSFVDVPARTTPPHLTPRLPSLFTVHSMSTSDGHRIVETGKQRDPIKLVSCSRWKEMQQTVDYHAQLAALLKSPTVFRMLNDPGTTAGPQQFSIAERGDECIDEDLAVAQQTMLNTNPGGVTPLTRHVREMRDNVLRLEPGLRRNGTKVVIVLATDGLPTDPQGYSNDRVKQEFVEALRSLEGLPVWVVVRLCTDEESVVDFWNNLDSQLELSLEVLDDFTAEAAEVYEHNKWLNYGLPLHRMREMGFHNRLFDLLDERKLSKDELRDFLKILFGTGPMDEAPDPEADWKGFVETVAKMVDKEKKQWNPVKQKMEPWVDVKRLKKEYGGGWFSW